MNQTRLLILALLPCSLLKSYGQAGNLDVEGAIRIGNSTDSVPEAGTTQWTGGLRGGYRDTETQNIHRWSL